MLSVGSHQPQQNAIQLIKIYCMIQLDDYAGALKEMEHDTEEELVLFEKAYCFYKLNRHDDALDMIHRMKSAQMRNEACMKLEAQIVRKDKMVCM
jgi:hypothetical protein